MVLNKMDQKNERHWPGMALGRHIMEISDQRRVGLANGREIECLYFGVIASNRHGGMNFHRANVKV